MSTSTSTTRPLDGHVYVITGASGALARAVIERFAAAGAQLALVDLHTDGLTDRARALGGIALGGDLTRLEDAQAAICDTLDHFGRLDGVVHTVGGFAYGPVHEASPATLAKMVALNLTTTFAVTRAVLPHLRSQGRGFLGVVSAGQAWHGGAANVAAYAASKAAVATFLHSVDAELTGTDVHVGIVYPMGVIDTEANAAAMPDADRSTWIDPAALADAFLFAATRGPRGRTLDLPVYPRR